MSGRRARNRRKGFPTVTISAVSSMPDQQVLIPTYYCGHENREFQLPFGIAAADGDTVSFPPTSCPSCGRLAAPVERAYTWSGGLLRSFRELSRDDLLALAERLAALQSGPVDQLAAGVESDPLLLRLVKTWEPKELKDWRELALVLSLMYALVRTLLGDLPSPPAWMQELLPEQQASPASTHEVQQPPPGPPGQGQQPEP